MSGKLIALIYFYLISAAALALIVIGIFNSVNYFVNTTQFEKYPLLYRNENCDLPYATDMYSMPVRPEGIASPSAKEQEDQKLRCMQDIEKERKQRQVDDLKNAITFTLVGVVLFAIHFPQARKQSKS